MSRKVLDCKGISCPKPIIRLSQALKEMQPGDEVEVDATDPNFTIDVQAWAERTGNALLGIDENDGTIRARIRVA